MQSVRDNFGRATVVRTYGTLETPEQKCATGHYQELTPTDGDNSSARDGRCISIIVFETDPYFLLWIHHGKELCVVDEAVVIDVCLVNDHLGGIMIEDIRQAPEADRDFLVCERLPDVLHHQTQLPPEGRVRPEGVSPPPACQ